MGPVTAAMIHDDARPTGAQVGNKFARLAEMRAAGLPVPRFCCLDAAVFRDVAREIGGGIRRELDAIDFTDRASLDAAAKAIRDLFLDVPFPAGVERSVLDAFDATFAPGSLVAVRSSSVGRSERESEDSAADPFAGMGESFLYVGRDRVLDRVRECWASGFTAEALLYRHVQGLALDGFAVSVGVQEMVLGAKSFVLFTCDPATGADDAVLAAGHGIGEGVVQEKVGVDHYFLRSATGRCESHLAHKPERLGLDPDRPDAGPVPLPVPPELRDAPVLDEAQVREVAALGARVAALFGAPQDVEGVLTEDGTIRLVQARPIAIDLSTRKQWSNANVTESFSGTTTALTYSFARGFYRTIFHDLYRRYGVDRDLLDASGPELERMIGYLGGRVYYDLDSWLHLHGQVAFFPLLRASWEQMMGLPVSGEGSLRSLAPTLPGVVGRLAGPLSRLLRALARHDRAMREFETWWEGVIAPRRAVDWAQRDPLARIADFRAAWREVGAHWGVTLINDSVLSATTGAVRGLLAKWAPGLDERVLNDLLCGGERNRGEAAVLSAVGLAELARARPEFLAAMDDRPAAQVWSEVDGGRHGDAFRAAVHEHLHRYGDRSVQDLKMEQPTLRAQPGALLRTVADYARAGLDRATFVEREERIRADAERRLTAALGARSPKLAVLRRLLDKLRRSVRHRENSRYCRSELFGLAKTVFHSLGEDLAAQGVLRSAADVVHLTEDEVFGHFDGTGVTRDLGAVAAVRKAEFEQDPPELPERFSTLGGVTTSLGAVRAAADPGGGELRGLGSSSGRVEGTARIVLDPRDPVEPGEDMILIARETDPGWLFLMLTAKGIVVERGTMLSHTAITGRKFGIPTVVSLRGATTAIPDGARIAVDGASGEVTVLEVPS
ncbi:hypothetical protein LCD36_19815 [Saccharopolyspora sp. 6T]|uniref:PEP/pyruvate-binding domain-containing protein n=1 Tax=Saccharopolyspora sp. 6T TaxID=2877238 RepID=UPI001CD5E74F|nr:PEP/pyruvate-binding domain-containing protein [Saccharopolyspora sp. 6T]MCA1188677.1 hypothetical protein [Saccharopolyspora sp. 6T]